MDTILLNCLAVLTYIHPTIIKIIEIGITTAPNKGIMVMITIVFPMKSNDKEMRSLMLSGSIESQTLISVENLFMILPKGVVSKKDNGHFMIR